jgi:hypothetical protein
MAAEIPSNKSFAPYHPVIDEPPPVLGTWPRVYAFVIVWLVVVITSLYIFSQTFTP